MTIILSSALFQKGIDYNTVLSMMNTWNENKVTPSLSQSELEITINSAYRQVQNGRRYGCASIKNNGLCIGRKCRIFKGE